MGLRPAAWFLLLAVALPACTHVVSLQPEPTLRTIARPGALDGARVAILGVEDRRPSSALGRHRDGLLRVHQHAYEGAPAPARALEVMLRASLREAGAAVVPAGAPADLGIRLELEALDLTTDGPLAGEETFGAITVRVVLFGAAGERVLDVPHSVRFEDPDAADPTMVRYAMQRMVGEIVSRLALAPGAPARS